MSYTLEVKRTSNHSPRSKYGRSSKPVGICIHHWGGTGQQHDNVVRWLRGAAGGVNNRNSSAHYVTSAGRVTKLADHNRATWHSGSNKGNGEDIGIECRPEMSDGDWATLVELCADIEEQEGSLKYRKHSDYKATACPGKYSDMIGQLVKDVNAEHARRKSGKPAPKPKPAPAPKPAGDAPAWPFAPHEYIGPEGLGNNSISGYHRGRAEVRRYQQRMKDRGWSRMLVDGLYGQRGQTRPADSITGDLTMQFQREKGLAVDGLPGPATWAAAWEEPVT